jgi:N-formylglutamate amidohydrolase
MNPQIDAASMHKPFTLHHPSVEPIALVLDSPHSSPHLPADMHSVLSENDLRDGEDLFVDELWKEAPQYGAQLLVAGFSRVYIDPNRHLADIDLSMLDAAWPHELQASGKASIGKALIWRTLDDGRPIYDRLLSVEEVAQRIAKYAAPYQAQLAVLINNLHREHGHCYHINCHSMNAVSGKMGQGGAGIARADVVLGDRDGSTCEADFTSFVEAYFKDLGLDVKTNDPFKGVELVRAFSAPAQGRHSLQIELNKRLYLQADGRTPSANFENLQQALTLLIAKLADYIASKSD